MKADMLVIDGRHLLWRTNDSFRLSVELDGVNVPTGGVYGFLSVATKLHAKFGGTVAVAWEGRKNFRREIYPEYKRKHIPNKEPAHLDFIHEMALQEGMLRDLLSAIGVRQYVGVGCEADDVIGRLARTLSEKGKRVLIYSGDSDLRQLVGPYVATVSPSKGKIKEVVYDDAAVLERHGVLPDKIAQLKALAGDSSDNIPGVRGVGPKTAAILLNHYGDLESVVAASASKDPAGWPVPLRFREPIAAAAENLKLYLRLTIIDTSCEMEKLPCVARQSAVVEALVALKFRSMASPNELRALMGLGKGKS